MSGSDGYMDFTFDEGDDKVERKSTRFKGKEGETYRVSFVWFDDDGKIRFIGCRRHYVQGVGYFLHKGPEFTAAAGGPPKQAVATFIVVWPTNSAGQLNREAFARGEGFEVKSWVFSAERYSQLKMQNAEFPLAEFDLVMRCKDTQYQKMDLSPCRESLFLKLRDSGNERGTAIAQGILDAVKSMEASLQTEMAHDLDIGKVREKMGGASPASSVSGGAAENVDGLLDDLLDD